MKSHSILRFSSALVTAVRSGPGLALAVLLVILGNLIPFGPVSSWTEFEAALRTGLKFDPADLDLVTILQRLLVFLPLGLLLRWSLSRWHQRRSLLLACALVALIALVIELAQAAVSIRHARLTDFLSATLYGVLGATLVVRAENPSTLRRRVAVRLLVIGNLVIIPILWEAHVRADIQGWDCSYPLLLANELTWDRPWQGKIRGLAIYPRLLNGGEIEALSRLPLTAENTGARTTAGALLIYLFSGLTGNRIRQLSTAGPPLDLELLNKDPAAFTPEPGAIAIRGPLLIRSIGAAREMCQAITKSRAFTLETEIESADPRQGGPARIISNSRDPVLRNFTLGEEKEQLILRVRTPINGPNGSKLELQSKDRVMAGGWHRIYASYGQGTARLYADGGVVAPTLRYYSLLPVHKGFAVSLTLVTGPLFFLMGVTAFFLMLHRPSWVRWPVGVAAVAMAPVAAGLAITAWYAHGPDLSFIATAILGESAGLAVGQILYPRLKTLIISQ